MGAWGYGLLDSDDAYDVLDAISEKINLDFEYLIEGFENLESENRTIIREKLAKENIWKELIYDKNLKQFIVFSLYISLGLKEFISLITSLEGKDINNSINIFKKNLYNFEHKKYFEYKETLDLVFDSFDKNIPFPIKSKSLFEC
jgi:hypothetical protein